MSPIEQIIAADRTFREMRRMGWQVKVERLHGRQRVTLRRGECWLEATGHTVPQALDAAVAYGGGLDRLLEGGEA